MANAHIGSVLPLKNRVLGVDEHTTFLAHYDLNEHDVLRGVKAVGQTTAPFWSETRFVATGAQYNIQTNLTLSAWVCPTAVPIGDRGCLMIGKGVGGYYLTIDSTLNLGVYWHGKSPEGYHASNATCPLNTWTHVAAVWSSQQLKLYINGELDRTIAVTGLGNRVDYVDLGTESVSTRPYRGQVRDFGIWAVDKSQDDIKRIMNKGMDGNENGLRAFWRMDEGQGTILRDSSPFEQDLVLEPSKTLEWQRGDSVFTLHQQEGKFGGGIAIEEPTSNRVVDPGFNWVTAQSVKGGNGALSPNWAFQVYPNTEISPSTGAFLEPAMRYAGEKVLRIEQRPGGNSETQVTQSGMGGGLLPTKHYTLSVYCKTDVKGVARINAHATREDGTSSWANASSYHSGSGKWERLSLTLVGVTSIGTIRMQVVGRTTTSTSYWSCFQIEEKPFSSSFTSGSRGAPSLEYPPEIIDLNAGTISMWFRPSEGFFTGTWNRLIGMSTATNTNELQIMRANNTDKLCFALSGPAGLPVVGWDTLRTTTPIVVNQWHHVAATWSKTEATASIYLNGVKEHSVTLSDMAKMPAALGKLTVGYHPTVSSRIANSLIDELRIDRVARTPDEIAAWYESNSPFWPRGIYRKDQ